MSKRMITEDDITGRELHEDAEEVEVLIDDKTFKLDLAHDTHMALFALIAGGDIKPLVKLLGPSAKDAKPKSTRRPKGQAAKVRAWAKANGREVGDRARIPAALTKAWEDAGKPEPEAA